MGMQSDVIFIDKQVLLNTYRDLGIKGLDVYAGRSAKVFFSNELLLELREAVGGSIGAASTGIRVATWSPRATGQNRRRISVDRVELARPEACTRRLPRQSRALMRRDRADDAALDGIVERLRPPWN